MVEVDGYWGEGYFGEGYWGEGYWGEYGTGVLVTPQRRFQWVSPPRMPPRLLKLIKQYLEMKVQNQ